MEFFRKPCDIWKAQLESLCACLLTDKLEGLHVRIATVSQLKDSSAYPSIACLYILIRIDRVLHLESAMLPLHLNQVSMIY
jgi:hypothetical protein